MKGKRIKTLQQLAKAAQERKAVLGWNWTTPDDWRPRPAAFVMNLSAHVVLRCLTWGLYIYHPERKKKAPAVRNPEGIDFKKHPIPKGYTVASEKDCNRRTHPTENWMYYSFSYGEWKKCTGFVPVSDDWTYLRPLHRGEKGVRV